MHFDRRRRRWLSGWLIVGLLFMQLATAAYACPKALTPAPTQRVMSDMPDMPGCDGSMSRAMDPGQPQLCKAHCEQGQQLLNPMASGDAPASPVLLAVLDWNPVALVQPHRIWRAGQAPSGAPPPGSPPLYIALLVLRN